MGKYRDEIQQMMDNQVNKGYGKYGIHLEDNGRTLIESIDAACEELIDALFYLREMSEKLKYSQRQMYIANLENQVLSQKYEMLKRHG